MGLHSGVDAPGGRDTRAPSGAQKSLQGGSRLLTGHRGVPLRGAGSMSNDPPPATIPEAVHATRAARGFTSSEPCSTTSPPGSFPAAHVARTELNDHRPQDCSRSQRPLLRARLVLGRSPGYNATHPPAIPPPECRPPPPNRTPPPTQPGNDRCPRPRGTRRTGQPHPHGPPSPARSIMRLAGTKRTPGAANLMIDAAGRAEQGGSSEAPRDRSAILQFEPPGCAIRTFCGAPKCKIGEEGGDGGPLLPEGRRRDLHTTRCGDQGVCGQ